MDNLSCLVSDILDCIGYSQDIINVRRNYWQQSANICNLQTDKFTLTIAGSKAEGITSFCESDMDLMFLQNDAVCTDDIKQFPLTANITVLHADTRDAPPGYTRLRLVSCNGTISRSLLRESVFESEQEELFLSSSLFASNIMHTFEGHGEILYHGLSGPAIAMSITDNIPKELYFDQVSAFRCNHSKLLQTWKSRRRFHTWPPADVRNVAASKLSQIVPIGSKGSCDQWREWRFCFIESELILTFSLNETQIKLYILLKMVAKDILKIVSNEISSYIMKNITFWLSELLPGDLFRKENLLPLLFLSLRFLKSAISNWNWLPYYMIPARNLLAERLSHDSRRQLSDMIGMLIDEGPMFMMRCTKLQISLKACLSSPATLVEYRRRRKMVETLCYLLVFLKQINADKSIISTVANKLLDSVVPEWKVLKFNGFPAEYIKRLFGERRLLMLS